MTEPDQSPPRRFSWPRLLLGLLPFAVLAAMVAAELPICPFRGLFGVPCPGCGLTRASLALASGDVATMWVFHPLAPILAPLVAFTAGRAVLVYAGAIDARFDPLARVPNWVWGLFTVVLLGLWVARAAGLLGGLPDPLDLTRGFLYRAASFLVSPLTGAGP